MEDLLVKSSWEQVVISELQQINEAAKSAQHIDMNDPNNQIDYYANLLSILSNKNADYFYNLSLPEFKELTYQLSFLTKKPDMSEVKGNYEVAGITYNISKTIGKLSKSTIKELKAIQYIDFLYINSQKKESDAGEWLHRELAILMIPEGKEYGEKGFDIEQTQEHLRNHLSVCDALAISAFFLTLFRTLTTTISTSLERNLKQQIRKIQDPGKRNMLLDQMKSLDNFRYQTNSHISGVGYII